MKTITFAILLLFLLALTACSMPLSVETSPVTSTELPTSAPPQTSVSPSPTAPPTLPSFEEIVANHAFSADCIPKTLYPVDTDLKGYDVIIKNKQITQSFTDCFSGWLSEVIPAVQQQYEEFYPQVAIATDITAPTWQLLASVAYGCETPEEFTALFPSLINVNIEKSAVSTEENASFTMTVQAKTPQQLFYELPRTDTSDPSSIPHGLFTCTYLNTAYDDNMEMIGPEAETLPALSEPLTFPFAKRYDFSDGWYADRDGGARRHTGTDILCPEGTPELACVDGTVLAVGTGEGTGNYVVIEGEDGTQYHYYHMVEISNFVSPGDLVKCGDVVGLAGNTGNSTADHLHLAIIHPSGVYVNPYPYLKDASMPDAA